MIGSDDRIELADVASPAREILRQSTVALSAGHRFILQGTAELRLNALTLEQAQGVCADEPFADQPTAASCSGVLIDDDLVLSAGHCLGQLENDASEACRSLRVAFGYSFLQKDELSLLAEDLFFCRRVVAWRNEPGRDFVVFQLDRAPSAPWVPAALAQSRVTEGDLVLLASHSAGLPLKVQENVPISVSSEDFLSAETDTFSGSSGGPLYDSELNVVAIAGSGAADWESLGGCTRSAHTDHGNERQIWIEPAWAALCDSGWPSVRLCGSEPRCGDGICSPSEGSDSCARDCAAALCGDGLCELSERATCEPDCHAFDAVPAEALDPVRYLARRRTDSVYSAKGGCGLARHGSADSREGLVGAAAVSLLGLLGCRLRRRRTARRTA